MSSKITEAIEQVAAELLAGRPAELPMTERPVTERPVTERRDAGPRPELKGHIDAVGNGRVFGWAWCPSDPQARLEVQLFAGETELARGLADKGRIDLRRNGIGDGAHAFDFTVPEGADAPLRILARHPAGGETIELRLPGEDREIESAAASPFGIALDRLDFLIGRHRQLQNGHGALLRQIKELGDKFSEPSPAHDSAVIELEGRINQFDVVLDRVDHTLADFQSQLQLLSRKSAHGVAPQLLLLGVIVGILIGVGLAAAFGV